MIHPYLIKPRSVAVVGATDNLASPGGRLLDNLLRSNFKGEIYPVNPKKKEIRGLKVYPSVDDLPAQVDTALIAVAAPYVEDIVRTLTREKGTRGFIIISAGFSDAGPEGSKLEKRIVRLIEDVGGTLLGPNNIGLINMHYTAVFTTPVPALDENGADLISGSGATAVFIIESAMQRGMRFRSVWTVGNSAQIGIEEVLEYIDTQEDTPPRVIMLYMEHIRKPYKLLKHAQSLRRKGFQITGIKAGNSQAGSRAAASHTGAMATPSVFTEALFQKAGILPADGRFDLVDKAMIMTYPQAKGKRAGIVTHAGGPAVMLTDTLERHGMEVPPITHPKKEELKSLLYPGASVENPIDILATGTASQLEAALDYTDKYFDNIDLIPVIFGSPGLFPVFDAYDVIWEKIQTASKPVYPIFPSVINVKDEIQYFIDKGGRVFFDEVTFGKALAAVYNRPPLFETNPADAERLMTYETGEHSRFLDAEETYNMLREAGLPVAEQRIITSVDEWENIPDDWYPVVIKGNGPLHKTEENLVALNLKDKQEALRKAEEFFRHPQVKSILVQPYIKGKYELFAGIHSAPGFGKLLLFGKGGTDVELWNDTARVLLPATRDELVWHLKQLRIYPLFQGYRNQAPLPEEKFLDLLGQINQWIMEHPEITEMDLNPVIVTPAGDLKIVDARVKVSR